MLLDSAARTSPSSGIWRGSVWRWVRPRRVCEEPVGGDRGRCTLMSSAPSPSVAFPAAPLRFARDDRLLRLAAGGEPAAFSQLYRRHHQVLYRYARTLVRHEQ